MTESSTDLVVTRVIDAPVERVWQAWTDAEQVKRWLGAGRHVVTFEPAGEGRTRLSITEYGYISAEIMEMSKLGQEQVVDKLAAVCTS